MRLLDCPQSADPLGALAAYAALVFHLTETDPEARRVFEIATLKTEYVDEMSSVRQRRAQLASGWRAAAESRIAQAVSSGQAGPAVDPRAGALGLWALMDGLVRAWMVAPDAFALSATGSAIVSNYVDALRSRA